MNAPETVEGWQVWDLVLRASSQMRVGPAGGVIGLDMGAVLAMGEALGIDATAAAELLPAIETRIVKAMNRSEEA